MIEYIILYCSIFFFSLIFKHLLDDKEKAKEYVCLFVFFELFVLLGCRHPSMGKDLGSSFTDGYIKSFEFLNMLSWEQIMRMGAYLNYDKGYIFFNKLIGTIAGDSIQLFIAACALVCLLPIGYTVAKRSKNVVMSICIYLGLPTFLFIFSGLRQGIAIGLCFYSLNYIVDKKPLRFIFLVLIACTFHYSAIAYFIAYPLYRVKIDKRARWLSVLALPVIFALRHPIFTILSRVFVDDVQLDDNGSMTLLLVFSIIYIFCIFFGKNSEIQNGYMNIFYIACVCQIFGNIYGLALRVGYYFVLALVLLLPEIWSSLVLQSNRRIISIGICGCFIIYGLYSIYISEWANAYPYRFFFEIC